jgi:ADP-ribosylglycohydrolase
MNSKTNDCLARAHRSLEGLSVGDALGGFFEFAPTLSRRACLRRLPKPIWRYTDDTNMALSLFAILRQYGEVEQDKLAANLAHHYDRARGYGLGTRGVLRRIKKGYHWSDVAPNAWGGGSYGNGGTRRAALVGAYFAEETTMNTVIEQARRSAEVTHAHPESIAGAIAIAVAAVWAWRNTGSTRQNFLRDICPFVPHSVVRERLCHARDLPQDTTLDQAVLALGNGSYLSAQDTVPFALWCAGKYLNDYQEALWQTASAGGDVDTIAAMVGSIVVMFTGLDSIPVQWRQNREPLPEWARTEACYN